MPAISHDTVGPPLAVSHDTVWPPMVVMVVKALENYGHRDAAADLAERYARALAATFKQCGDITEHSWIDRLGPGATPNSSAGAATGPSPA